MLMVVSLMGSTCSARWCVEATQSTMFFRSPKSPTPKLPSVFSEKMGTTVPASL